MTCRLAWSALAICLGALAMVERAASRQPSYEDLIAITDIGLPSFDAAELPALSPDRRFLAVEIRKSLLAENRTEIRWFVVTVDGGRVVDVGDGGDMTLFAANGLIVGNSLPQVPKWSPDSQWIAYTAKHRGSTQVWRSSRDGRTRGQLTRNAADVQALAWSADGRKIYFQVDEQQRANEAALESEAMRGFHYDHRFAPFASRKPLPVSTAIRETPANFWVYDLTQKQERLATAAEREEYKASRDRPMPDARARHHVRARTGTVDAWLEDIRPEPRGINPPMTVVASKEAGTERLVCPDRACTGRFKGLWLDDDGRTVYFLRWSGEFAYGPLSLYAWKVGSQSVTQVLQTDAFLDGCAFTGSSLICGVETSTQPRYIGTVSLRDGTIRSLADLNADLADCQFGQVDTLTWKDQTGAAGFGHLVKPIDYVPGRRYPLVIVQYRSRGFLRGGVGDEYPVHVLAAKGFAVLSFDRPEDWEAMANARTTEEFQKQRNADSRDRRRVLSVLLAGIEQLEGSGLVDAKRVGITGLSDGAETAAFAVIHASDRFAAAAVSSIWREPVLFHTAGPEFQAILERTGFSTFPGGPTDDAWRRVSVALNAEKVKTPILVQVADSELLPAAQAVSALTALHKPVEMYVFPEEGHNKVQPRHRLNVYKRNVQWLQFWLQNRIDPDPVDPTQYQRWEAWRDADRISQR
jgi:dipeptidyl aminopeptidase/acylaminoacyl peptidase